jgi:hypothetical protein
MAGILFILPGVINAHREESGAKKINVVCAFEGIQEADFGSAAPMAFTHSYAHEVEVEGGSQLKLFLVVKGHKKAN